MSEKLAKIDTSLSKLNQLRQYLSARPLLIPPIETNPMTYGNFFSRGGGFGVRNFLVTGFRKPTGDTRILNKEVKEISNAFGLNYRGFRWTGLPFGHRDLEIAILETEETVGRSFFHLMALPENKFTDPEARQAIGQRVFEINEGGGDITRIIHVGLYPSEETAKLAAETWKFITNPHKKLPYIPLDEERSLRSYLSQDTIAAIKQLQLLFHSINPKAIKIILEGVAQTGGLETYIHHLTVELKIAAFHQKKSHNTLQ